MGLFDGTALERPVLCEQCGGNVKECDCAPPEPEKAPDTPPEKQRLKVRVEKRKRGKMMTVAAGFSCQPEQLQDVLTGLKNHCGAGGTIDGEQVEIQGSHSGRVTEFLKQRGYKVS